ncbi:MAG: DUF393 domain-containing protein [Calditrichaeota bacterium]|nr:MAG: DUF393 domain-containing protein [Calditrichota bacterium]
MYIDRRSMEKSIILYDEKCGLCRSSRNWIERRKFPGSLELIPCSSPERAKRFPHISEEECMSAVKLISSGGQIYSGADAIPEILKCLKGWRNIVFVFRLPLLHHFSARIYLWIARRRGLLSCAFFPNS